MVQPTGTKPFYTYLREERQFSFLLAFFLMQRGPALGQFLELADSRNNTSTPARASEGLEDAEVYVEFAPLRDQWAALLSDESTSGIIGPAERLRANVSKRAYVAGLLKSVPSLAPIAELATHESVADFNAFFMGDAGKRITRDIASPALWSVAALAENFGKDPRVFIDLCRLKWSFHIKPDVVVVRSGLPSICIEAKLESGEGSYPTGEEAKLFDSIVGPGNRVGQFGLQIFLFETLLKTPCLPVVVQKVKSAFDSRYPVLTWAEVFNRFTANETQMATTTPFVGRLVRENRSLITSYQDAKAQVLEAFRLRQADFQPELPQCSNCVWLQDTVTGDPTNPSGICFAFPDGIPMDIFNGFRKHDEGSNLGEPGASFSPIDVVQTVGWTIDEVQAMHSRNNLETSNP